MTFERKQTLTEDDFGKKMTFERRLMMTFGVRRRTSIDIFFLFLDPRRIVNITWL